MLHNPSASGYIICGIVFVRAASLKSLHLFAGVTDHLWERKAKSSFWCIEKQFGKLHFNKRPLSTLKHPFSQLHQVRSHVVDFPLLKWFLLSGGLCYFLKIIIIIFCFFFVWFFNGGWRGQDIKWLGTSFLFWALTLPLRTRPRHEGFYQGEQLVSFWDSLSNSSVNRQKLANGQG